MSYEVMLVAAPQSSLICRSVPGAVAAAVRSAGTFDWVEAPTSLEAALVNVPAPPRSDTACTT